MEGYKQANRKLFSEFAFLDEKDALPTSNGPTLKLEGSEESVHLSEQEFRVLLFLRQRQGDIASIEEIETFLYGDDDADISLSNLVAVVVKHLNGKLKSIQHPPRFLILSQIESGYYLADLQHPEKFYQGAEPLIKGLTDETRGRKKISASEV